MFIVLLLFLVGIVQINAQEEHYKYKTLFGGSVILGQNTEKTFIDNVVLTKLVYTDSVARTIEFCHAFCRSQEWCLAADGCDYITDLTMLNMDNDSEKDKLTHESFINIAGQTFIVNNSPLLGNYNPSDGTISIIDPSRIVVLDDEYVFVDKFEHPEPESPDYVYTYYYGTNGPDKVSMGVTQSLTDGDLVSNFFNSFPVVAFTELNMTTDPNTKPQPFRTYYKNTLLETTTCNIHNYTEEIIHPGAYMRSRYFKMFIDENYNSNNKGRRTNGPHKYYINCDLHQGTSPGNCYYSLESNTLFSIVDYKYDGNNNGFHRAFVVTDQQSNKQIGFLGVATNGCDFIGSADVVVSHEFWTCKYSQWGFYQYERSDVDYDIQNLIIGLCKKDVQDNSGISRIPVEPCISNVKDLAEVFTDNKVRLAGFNVFNQHELQYSIENALSIVVEPYETYDPDNVNEFVFASKYFYCNNTRCSLSETRKQLFVFEENGVIHPAISGGHPSHNNAFSKIAIYEKNEYMVWDKVGYLGTDSNKYLLKKDLYHPEYNWVDIRNKYSTQLEKISMTGVQDTQGMNVTHIINVDGLLGGATYIDSIELNDSVYVFLSNGVILKDNALYSSLGQSKTFTSVKVSENIAVLYNSNPYEIYIADLYNSSKTHLLEGQSISNINALNIQYQKDGHILLSVLHPDGLLTYMTYVKNDVSTLDLYTFDAFPIPPQSCSQYIQTARKNGVNEKLYTAYINTLEENDCNSGYQLMLFDHATKQNHSIFGNENHSLSTDIQIKSFNNRDNSDKLRLILQTKFNSTMHILYYININLNADNYYPEYTRLAAVNDLINWDVDIENESFAVSTNKFISKITHGFNTTNSLIHYGVDVNYNVGDTVSSGIIINNKNVLMFFTNDDFSIEVIDYNGMHNVVVNSDDFVATKESVIKLLRLDNYKLKMYYLLDILSPTNNIMIYDINIASSYEDNIYLQLSGSGYAVQPVVKSVHVPTSNNKMYWKHFSEGDDLLECDNHEYIVSTRYNGGKNMSIACYKLDQSDCLLEDELITQYKSCTNLKRNQGVMVGIYRNLTTVLCRILNVHNTHPRAVISSPFVGKIAYHQTSKDGKSDENYKNPFGESYYFNGFPLYGVEIYGNNEKIKHHHFFNSVCSSTNVENIFTTASVTIPGEISDCSLVKNGYVTHVGCHHSDCRDGVIALCVCSSKCSIGVEREPIYYQNCPSGMIVTSVVCEEDDEGYPCGVIGLKCAPVVASSNPQDTCSTNQHSNEFSDLATIGEILGGSVGGILVLVGLSFLYVCCVQDVDTPDIATAAFYKEKLYTF